MIHVNNQTHRFMLYLAVSAICACISLYLHLVRLEVMLGLGEVQGWSQDRVWSHDKMWRQVRVCIQGRISRQDNEANRGRLS